MFYVIEIATGDAQITGKAVYEYATEKDAVATFHTKMGNAMKSSLYATELLMVVDDKGTVLKREKYAKPIEPVIVDPVESETSSAESEE